MLVGQRARLNGKVGYVSGDMMFAYGFSIKSSFNDTIIEGHLDVEKKEKYA